MAEALVRRLGGGREGETIAGDLREEFAARGGGRLWYWRQAFSCLAVRLSPYRLSAPDLRQDFHYALRMVRRNPGYALTAMFCLALGIGVNSTMFTMVDELFWQTLPVPQANRVVVVGRTGQEATCSYRDYEDIERRVAAPGGRLFTGLVAYDELPTSLDSEGVSQMIMAQAVTANFASTLGLTAQVGRWFQPEDDRVGADPVAVLSDHAWTRRFGRNPNAIGQRVRIETQWFRVIGVAPAGFIGISPPHSAEIWVPFTSQPYVREALARPGERERPRVRLIGRLAPGIGLRAAQAELRAVDEQVWRAFPRDKQNNSPLRMDVAAGATMPAAREVAAPMAIMLLSVTGVVLLIACVNVANLLLSRSAVRRREMAVRQALGAGRWRLARQTFVEGTVLALGGAVLGLLSGVWTNRLLAQTLPSLPHIGLVALDLKLNWRVAVFALAAALVSAVLFSISPAFEHSRGDLTTSLKGQSGGGRRMRQRDVYVVAQVALSLVLLIVATLLVRALQHAQDLQPGFALDHRLAARIYISAPEYTPESGRLFFDRVLERLRATPGVRSATLSYSTPLSFSDGTCAAAEAAGKPPRALGDTIVPGYFETMHIPLLRGRQFTAADLPGTTRVAIVNETMARRLWRGEDPVGKTVWLGCDVTRPRVMAEVVGLARDAKYRELDESPRPMVYRPLAQSWVGFVGLIAETAAEPGAFTAPLRETLRSLDPTLRVYEIRTLEQYASESLWKVRWQATLLGSFGLLGMVLAAVGLYGVIAYTVAQRTQEIGVRMALGAQRSDVLWMVLARGLRLTSIGIAIGLALSASFTPMLRSFLYGLSPFDPVTFAGVALGWTGIAMLASYSPARRATLVDPVTALRWE
jgi:putative ABC transport system permease protein